MACCDPKLCEETRKQIIELTGNVNIYNRTINLASIKSIRQFVDRFLKDERRLDILINNAEITGPKSLTDDGFESQIGVNHMGHFLLTNLLLDILIKSAPSRIVVVSSMRHMYGTIDTDDLNSEKSYDQTKAYNQSKLANLLFTRHLAKLLNGTRVTVNALHPGVDKIDLTKLHPTIMLDNKIYQTFFYSEIYS